MSEYTEFIKAAGVKSHDQEHGRKILKAISSYEEAVCDTKSHQFIDWKQAQARAKAVKNEVLSRLPELLLLFEDKAGSNGTTVLWAKDEQEAQQHVLEIARRHQARKAVKSKSMTTEEIHLNQVLEKEGLEVWESDLGELIVQLADETPYHIVTPAMHKSKSEISTLFTEKLGCPPTEDAAELTAAARNHLREAFCTADLGISGANFLIAEEGAIVLTENEGNARLSTACPPVHIAIAGIEKVLPRLSDLELFLPLLATSGTGQELTCYNSIIRGPRNEHEPDGPKEMYVILLDNGRTTLYAQDETRELLRCIRCGACLNACPIFRTVGGHTYQTTYQGPIGSAITPHLKGMAKWHHLSSASSLCGACTEVCPVGIKLHHHLLENRWSAHRQHHTSTLWNIGLGAWSRFVPHRSLLELFRPLMRIGAFAAARLIPGETKKRIPQLPKKSFYGLWKEHE